MARPTAGLIWLGWADTADASEVADRSGVGTLLDIPVTVVSSNPTILTHRSQPAARYSKASTDTTLGRINVASQGTKVNLNTQQVTLDAWIERDAGVADGNDRRLFGGSDGNGSGDRWLMLMGGRASGANDIVAFRFRTDGGSTITAQFDTGSQTAFEGGPHHLCIRCNSTLASGRIEAFLDGVSIGTSDVLNLNNFFQALSTPAELSFGSAHSSGARNWRGHIWKASMYDRRLTNQEIADLFALGHGPEAGGPTALAGRSATGTRTTGALTVSSVTELQGRSATDTRTDAALSINPSLFTGRSATPTRTTGNLSVAAGWWLEGDVDPANVVGAWQGRGAASYAASFSNLNNPGTADLYTAGLLNSAGNPITAPSWSSAGWVTNGHNSYFAISGGWFPTEVMSVIIQFEGAADFSMHFCGATNSTDAGGDEDGGHAIRNVNTFQTAVNWGRADIGGILNSGNLAIAGKAFFRDGVKNATAISAGTGTNAFDWFWGVENWSGVPHGGGGMTIIAMAAYSVVLTDAQVAAIAAAMAAISQGGDILTVDSEIYLRSTVTKTVDSSILLLATATKTVDSEIYLQSTISKTVDSQIYLTSIATRTIDSHVYLQSIVTKTVSPNIYLQSVVERTVNSSVLIQQTVSKTVDSHVVLASEVASAKTVTSHILLSSVETKTIDSEVYLQSTIVRTIDSDVLISQEFTKVVDSSIVLSSTVIKTITSNVYLSSTNIRTVGHVGYLSKLDIVLTVNSVVRLLTANVKTINSSIHLSQQLQLSADSLILLRSENLLTLGQLILLTQTRIRTVDSQVRIGNTWVLTVGSEIRISTARSKTVDSIILLELSGIVTQGPKIISRDTLYPAVTLIDSSTPSIIESEEA